MLIKFTLLFKQTWVNEFTGVFELRLEKPLTMNDVCLPSNDITTGVTINSRKIGKFTAVDYYHNCGNVSENVILRAINMFNNHYNGEFLAIGRKTPADNEFIDNFTIALAKAAACSNSIFEQNIAFTNERSEYKELVRSQNNAANSDQQEASRTSRL